MLVVLVWPAKRSEFRCRFRHRRRSVTFNDLRAPVSKMDECINLRQSLPAAGIIEESESARGERGRVGQGRVGFRV